MIKHIVHGNEEKTAKGNSKANEILSFYILVGNSTYFKCT